MSTPTLKAAPRAVIYTRVSTDEQAEHGTSLKSQLETCRKKAQQLGAVIVGHHEDAGISGGLYWEREGLQRALAIIEAGQADTLIVATMSRLSRDTADAVVIDGRIRRAGAEIVYCDAHYDNSAMGKFARHVSQGVVDLERNIISERVRMGMHKKANEGTQPYRRFSPYGYHIVTKDDVLTGVYPAGTQGTYQVIEAQAATVREIFHRYAGGASLFQVARWLHDTGVSTVRNGSKWHPSAVKSILTNPVYKGTPVMGRTQRVTDEKRIEAGKAAYYYKRTSEESWIELEAPALVAAGVWETCQQRLKSNQSLLGGRPTTNKYLLTGLMRCANCGRCMAVRPTRSGERTYHYYHCIDNTPTRTTDGHVCTPGYNNGTQMEELTVKALLAVTDRHDLRAAAAAVYEGHSCPVEGSGSADKLREALRGLQVRERATIEAQIAGVAAGADAAVYVRMLGEIAGQRRTLQARLERLEAASAQRPPVRAMLDGAAEVIGKARAAISDSRVPVAVRRELLTQIVRRVTPEAGGVRVLVRPLQGFADSLHYISILCKVSGDVEISIVDCEE